MRRVGRALLPRALTYTGVRPLWEALRRRRMPFVVGLNYHWTPPEFAGDLDAHLAWLQSHYTCLDHEALEAHFIGALPLSKPGMVLCFDDGYRNHHEVAAPALERHGLKGWFFVVAGTLDSTCSDEIPGIPRKFAMTAEQVRDLVDRGHVVGSHTRLHTNVGRISGDRLREEVVRSKEVIEVALGSSIDSFCYPFGTSDSFSPEAQALVSATYRFAFNTCPFPIGPSDSPLGIGRHAVAPDSDPHLVRLKASGMLDWKYAEATRRFRSTLAASAPAN